MTRELLLVGAWLAVLGTGLAICVGARALGMPRTYVRDLLHVGAGVWVLGWPLWTTLVAPASIVLPVAVLAGFVPILGARFAPVARLRASVSDGEERWSGIVLYVAAYAIFTLLGFAAGPFPAAAALLSLSLGDGLGGLAGRLAGRIRFRVPGAKTKSLEGSIVVALMSSAGTLLAARLFGATPPPLVIAGAGAVAAVTEAISPRSTDNLFVPAATWAFLVSFGGG
jgi:dolichol kinase